MTASAPAIGVVGVGAMGSALAAGLAPHARVVVEDLAPGRADQVAALSTRFPEHTPFFGAAIDRRNGSAPRRRFGNLVLARPAVEQCYLRMALAIRLPTSNRRLNPATCPRPAASR